MIYGRDVAYSYDASGNVTGLVAPGGSLLSQSNRLKKNSYTGIRALTGMIGPITTAAGGDTYQTVMEVDAPLGFDRIRFALPNHNTIGTVVVGPFIVATGNSIADPNTPAGGTGWTAVTFSGAATVTLPNATSAADPTVTWSDWVSISSVARTDIAGALPLVFLRGYVPAATTTTSTVTPNVSVTGWASRATRKYVHRLTSGVDGVTTPANFFATGNSSNTVFSAVQFASRGRTVSVYGVGDSISFGSGATLPGESFIFLACEQANTTGVPVSYINGGWPSQNSTAYVLRAERMIPLYLPDIAVYPAFSPNNGTPSQSVINTHLQNLARFLAVCSAYNVLPVVWTGLPYTGAWNASQDAFRTAFNVLVKSYPGTVVADIGGAAGDGASPESYKAGYSTDGQHPNSVGCAALAPVLANAIATVIAQ